MLRSRSSACSQWPSCEEDFQWRDDDDEVGPVHTQPSWGEGDDDDDVFGAAGGGGGGGGGDEISDFDMSAS